MTDIKQTKSEETPQTEKKKKLTLSEKYNQLQVEYDELKDRWMRGAAEFENFRKRTFTEKADWIKNATERLVLELCDVVDNFERALHPEVEKNREAFEKGIDMIFQQLEAVLKKEGVEKIDAFGKEFDPNLHEALAHIPSELEENKIVAVIQNGYIMNEKIIRPVRVAVSNGEKPKKSKEKLAANKTNKNEQ